MVKLKMPSDAAKALTVPERLLLLCVASAIDFKHAKIAEKVVTEVVVKGLIERDAAGHLALTDRGRAVVRAMLPDLWRFSRLARQQLPPDESDGKAEPPPE